MRIDSMHIRRSIDQVLVIRKADRCLVQRNMVPRNDDSSVTRLRSVNTLWRGAEIENGLSLDVRLEQVTAFGAVATNFAIVCTLRSQPQVSKTLLKVLGAIPELRISPSGTNSVR